MRRTLKIDTPVGRMRIWLRRVQFWSDGVQRSHWRASTGKVSTGGQSPLKAFRNLINVIVRRREA